AGQGRPARNTRRAHRSRRGLPPPDPVRGVPVGSAWLGVGAPVNPSAELPTDAPRQSSQSDGPPKPARPPELERAGASDRELFLLRLRYRHGRLLEVAGNKPVLLDDPAFGWVVFAGQVDVVGVP